MKTAYDVIVKPIITERSMEQMPSKKYTFAVALKATKVEIKQAIETVFPGVKVEKVATMRYLGKVKRMGAHEGKRADWKKAVVTLTAGSKDIAFFEGMQ